MAWIYDTAKSTPALRRRKRWLLSQLKIHSDSLRASMVERFARCGKNTCHCHHGGDKHGPFYYLTHCAHHKPVAVPVLLWIKIKFLPHPEIRAPLRHRWAAREAIDNAPGPGTVCARAGVAQW